MRRALIAVGKLATQGLNNVCMRGWWVTRRNRPLYWPSGISSLGMFVFRLESCHYQFTLPAFSALSHCPTNFHCPLSNFYTSLNIQRDRVAALLVNSVLLLVIAWSIWILKICSLNWNCIEIEFKWFGIEIFNRDRNWTWNAIELFRWNRNWP